MITGNDVCKCGHKRRDHSLSECSCYVRRRIKKCVYECVCDGFKEEKR